MSNNIGLSEQLIDFLEDHKGEFFSATELTEYLDAIKDVVFKKLRNLVKHNEIRYKRISCRKARVLYQNKNLKRGLNLYFLE